MVALLLAALYRRYVTYGNYENPPSVFTYSLVFEYLAFATIGLLFPWSYKLSNSIITRWIFIGFTALLFTTVYVTLLSAFEWIEAGRSYRLINGLSFNLPSAPFVLIIYAVFSLLLYYLNDKFVVVPAAYLDKVEVRVKNKVELVPLDRIELIASEGNYVSLYDNDGKGYLSRKTMKEMETGLDPAKFVRVHRQYIVNVQCVQSYESDQNGGYNLTLRNSKMVKLSKSYSTRLGKIKQATLA